MKYILLYSFIFLITIGNGSAQSFERSIALLDLTLRNGEENDGQVFSAEHILKVTGIPYSITADPLDAMQFAMIFCSSYLDSKTLTNEEKTKLIEYVSNGGVIIAPRVTDDVLNPIFGISGFAESNSNYLVNWNPTLSTPLFRWIDEPEEWIISLGKDPTELMFKTVSYALSNAIQLAKFENDSVAVAQNQYGIGYGYTFGFAWKDVILRSLINRDHEAQRISSNGFEPTMDVIMLLARAIFIEHIPYTSWKHTSLNNSTSTLMITHDIDSSTGIDSMYIFSESEKNSGISANYNITVRYFDDALMTDFYNGSFTEINKLISDGHVIGSHSVGHFPDFWDDDIFPIGSPGNTMASYQPYNSDDETATVGGTVYGEMEVSKDVLETDFSQDISIYRTGHLVYNKYMVEVMDELGYLYNSSYSANEVLTNFPYQNKTGRSFSGTNSNIYELPVSISDVYHDDPLSEDNYLEKADLWLDIISKIDANNASTVLLIHPNREYKILGQEYLIANLPQSIAIKEMGAFGDYWRAREDFNFTTQLIGNTLHISIIEQDLTLNEDLSLIINNGQDLENVVMTWEDELSVDFISENRGENDLILYDFKITVGISDLTRSNSRKELSATIFPNPIEEDINIELELKTASDISVELYDIYGHLIIQHFHPNGVSGHQILNINFNELQLKRSIYFCKINAGANGEIVQKVLIK